MAEVAARHLLGETNVQFLGADLSTKLKLMGVDVASIGDAHGTTPDTLNYVFTDEATGVYKKLVSSGDRKHLVGAILVGDASDYGTLLQMALNPLPLPEHPEDLILPGPLVYRERPRRRSVARVRAGLLVQQRLQGADLRRRKGRMRQPGRAEETHQVRDELRRVRAARKADHGFRAEEARPCGQQPALRALQFLEAGALSSGAHRRAEELRGADPASTGEAGDAISASRGGLDPRVVLERDDPRAEHAPLQDTNDHVSSPTCRRTARIRSFREFPAERSIPTS
jgi:hypothetical protein